MESVFRLPRLSKGDCLSSLPAEIQTAIAKFNFKTPSCRAILEAADHRVHRDNGYFQWLCRDPHFKPLQSQGYVMQVQRGGIWDHISVSLCHHVTHGWLFVGGSRGDRYVDQAWREAYFGTGSCIAIRRGWAEFWEKVTVMQNRYRDRVSEPVQVVRRRKTFMSRRMKQLRRVTKLAKRL